ncbi:Centromere/kinetochore protein zw10 [Rhizophlyctis rosea]|nr:Centromere/kinetochore protein zw10 [Rhizophlyctis rosea]
MASAEFAAHILRAVTSKDDATTSQTPTSFPTGVTTSVSRPSLQHAADVLDRSITDLQIQIESYISADFDGFRKHLEDAICIQVETRSLVSNLEAVAAKVEDEETGLQARLKKIVQEQEDAKQELQMTELLISSLQILSQCMDTTSEYDDVIKTADYGRAALAVSKMAEVLDRLPELSGVDVFQQMRNRYDDMTTGLRDRLEYIISQGLSIESNVHAITITVTNEVSAPGLGDIPVSLQAAMKAVHAQGAAASYFGIHARSLSKNVWIPLVTEPRWEITTSESDADPPVLKATCNYETELRQWKQLDPGAVLHKLETVLDFLESAIFNRTSSSHSNDDVKASFFRVIGSSWGDVSKTIIAQYLGTIIPDNPSGFTAFGDVATLCEKFEARLVDIGMISDEQKYLSKYCAEIDVHYANKRHVTLLSAARDIMLSDDHETVVIDEKEPEVPLQKLLQDLVDNILHEAEQSNPFCAKHLYTTTRDILDLFRAVMPIHNTQKFDLIPQMAIIFHNDCMYIAHRLLVLKMEQGAKMEEVLKPDVRLSFADLVGLFRVLGEGVFNAQLNKQKINLKECVENADGFDVQEQKRFDVVERAVKQIMHQLDLLVKIWKPVLPTHVYFRAIGLLINDILLTIINEVERLVDIAADESKRLNELLTRLHSCRDFYHLDNHPPSETDKLVRHYVPCFNKFVELTEVLDLGFAEIMERFRAGRLKEFGGGELQRLVRALFADTPLRVRNLEEIGRGVPRS